MDDAVNLAIDRAIPITTPVRTGFQQLMVACQQGNSTEVRQILQNKPSVANGHDRTGKTALHYCSENTNLSCAEEVLSVAPQLVGVADEEGYTPLHLAVINGNKILVRFLTSKNADVNAVDNEQHSLIHWATVCAEIECLDILVETGANSSTPDMHGAYPLHYAAQMCGPTNDPEHASLGMEVLRRLLFHGADVHVRDQDGREPLLWAASAGSSDAMLALVNAGADVKTKDKDGLTALHCAASRGHSDCLETLLTLCGVEVDTEDNNGCTSLFYAVTLGHADCTALLLRQRASPNHQDHKGRTAAHCGAAKGQLETLKILEKNMADLWKENQRGDLPLHDAVQSGRKELVLWLLSHRPAPPNYANRDGRTSLHIAAINNNVELCKILIDNGADVNSVMRNSKGQMMTPLDAALFRGNRGCANYLQLHGGTPAQKIGSERARKSDTTAAMEKEIEDDQRSIQSKNESIQTEYLSDGQVGTQEESSVRTQEDSSVQTQAQEDSDHENQPPEGPLMTTNALQGSGRHTRLERIPEEDKDLLQVNDSGGRGKKASGASSVASEDTLSIGQKDSGFSDSNRLGGRSDADDSDVLSSPAGITYIDNGEVVKRRPRRRNVNGRKDGKRTKSKVAADEDSESDVSDRDNDTRTVENGGENGRIFKQDRGENGRIFKQDRGENGRIFKQDRGENGRIFKQDGGENGRIFKQDGGENGQKMIASKRNKGGKGENSTIFRPKTGERKPLPQSTQGAFNNRMYQKERRIFQELLELKRVQLNADRNEEDYLVRKLSDNYRHQGLTINHQRFDGPHTFQSYEKYLYDQLRQLSGTLGYNGSAPQFKNLYDSKESIDKALDDPSKCTQRTYHCHHATHTYMGVPCVAYLKNKRAVPPVLPKINQSPTPSQRSTNKKSSTKSIKSTKSNINSNSNSGKEPVMLEIKHGSNVQKFTLPTGQLDKNKKYQLTFTLGPSSAPTDGKSNGPVLKPMKSV